MKTLLAVESSATLKGVKTNLNFLINFRNFYTPREKCSRWGGDKKFLRPGQTRILGKIAVTKTFEIPQGFSVYSW